MDELARQSTATVSLGRRRLKIVILAVAGISVVLILGALGYLVYNTVKENNSTYFEEPARIIQTTHSHQPSSLSSQTQRITYTNSRIPVTTKQRTTLLVPTNIRSTSTESNDISSSTKLTELISSSMAVETTESTSHQTSQSPKMTSTSSIVTSTTKQPSTLLASTGLLSTSSVSTKSISTSTESTESISSSFTVVTTEQTSQVNLLTSCESESSPDLDTSPLDCSYIEPCYSGVYYVFPYGEGNDSVPVYCKCSWGGKVWTVIQKRFNGSVDFNRNWTDYKNGFGDACGEYWLGNEALHQLTSNKTFKLRIIMESYHSFTKYAIYDTFSLANEANGYRLNLGTYSGNAGDSMAFHNNSKFSTGDRDNDANPTIFNHAVHYLGPWWYSNGLQSNLNGLYYNSSENPAHDGIIWSSFSGNDSLKETTMMMIPMD